MTAKSDASTNWLLGEDRPGEGEGFNAQFTPALFMHTYRRVRLASGFKNGKAAEKDGDESSNGDVEANGGSNSSGSVGRCLGISLNEVSS